MKILLSHTHSDCTYSLLKVLELMPDVEIYIPSSIIPKFITFLLDYEEWPINEFREIIRPLEELKSLEEIDYFFAEIVEKVKFENGEFSDVQVEWGIKNLGIKKIIVYCYNAVNFEAFKYRDHIPLISTSKITHKTYGSTPKHFFHGESPILPFSYPKTNKSLMLIQSSYERMIKTRPKFVKLYKSPLFKEYNIKYYGYTEDEKLKEINEKDGERIPRSKVDSIIQNEMTFALVLKDYEGYGYHPIKCLFAGRPVINFRENVKGMTYEDYLIDGKTAILVDSLEELKERLDYYTKWDWRLRRFSRRTAKFARKYFDFEKENQLTARFLQEKVFQKRKN